MSFAKDAIGFYLQVEDQMSPVLAKAVTNYEKFTKQLTDLNKKSFQTTQSAMDSLASITKSFDMLPKKAAASYTKTLNVLKKKMKPLTQRVDVVFTPKSEKTFSTAIAKAVARVLSRVQIRLGAAMPLKRARGYDTSQSLRAAYKETVQPPDMRGGFQNLPRFAEGGEVTGGQGKGIDDVLALLSKGEIVLPSDIAEKLKAMAAAAFDSGAALGKSEDISMLTDVVASLAMELGKLSSTHMDQEFEKAAKSADKLDDTMDDLTDTVEESNSAFGRLLQKTLGPAQFLAIQRSIDDLQRSFGGFEGSARDAFGQVAGGEAPVLGFIEALNESNIKLDLSREELAKWKSDLLDLAAAAPDLGPQQIGQAFKALTDAGSTSRDFLMEMSTLTAQIAETTGIGFDQAGQAVYRLGDAYGFTDDQIADVFANIKAASKVTAISLEELAQQQAKNLDNLGAFFDTLDSADDRAQALRGINQFAAAIAENWGEAGGQITDLFSQALAGNRDAQKSVQRLGVGVEELRMAAERGDFTMVLDDMTRAMTNMSGNGSDLAELAKIIEFPGTPAELSKLVNSSDAMLATLGRLQEATVPTSEAIDAMEQSTKNVTTGFERFKRSVSGFLAEKLGADTLEFFEDFNVQAAFATARLAQMSVEFGTAAVKAIFFRKASKGVVDTVSKTGGASQVFAKQARAGGGGKGVIGNFLTGIAQGMAAFAHPKVILGTAVITGALVGLAFAARTAKPVLSDLFGVFERLAGKVITMFERVFTTLTELDPKHALASAGAMLALGPALAGLGIGIATFGNTALLGVPGLIAFSKAIRFMSDETGDNPLATTINRLFDTFQFDEGKMKSAVRSISGAALFMAQLAGVTVAFGIMKTAAFFQKANPLEGLAILFGQEGMTAMLVANSEEIVRTIEGIATHYGNVSTSVMSKLEKAAPTFKSIGEFISTYAKIAMSFTGIKFAAAADQLIETYIQAFTKKTGFVALVEQKDEIIRSIKMLADNFTTSKIDTKKLDDTLPVFTSVAGFLEAYAKIAETFDQIAPGAIERVAEFYMEAYGIDSPLQAVSKQIATIREVVTNIATEFSMLGGAVDATVISNTQKGIDASIGLLEAFMPIVEKTEELNKLSENLQTDLWDDLLSLVGVDTPLEDLKQVLIGDGDEDGIIGTISSIGTWLAENTTSWKGIGTGAGSLFGTASKQASKLATLASDIMTAATDLVKANEAASAFTSGGLEASAQNIKMVIARLAGISEAFLALKAGELSPENLTPELNVPVTTTAEINKAVRVELDPNTTDRPVLSATQETNMLLAQILTAVQSDRGPRQVRESQPGAVRATKERVRSLAEGGD